MARSKSKSHILELELCFDHANPSSVLEHASNSATSIYNAALGECLKRYRKLCYDRRYQTLQKEYKEVFQVLGIQIDIKLDSYHSESAIH